MLRSLRFRILIPFLTVSLLAALLVAAGSMELGRRWAMTEVLERFHAIERTVRGANFPLTPSVLESIAGLTSTELLALGYDEEVVATTLSSPRQPFAPSGPPLRRQPRRRPKATEASEDTIASSGTRFVADGQMFLSYEFRRSPTPVDIDRVASVVVLFDQNRIDAASQRAALFPLATGLSTVVLMTGVSVLVSGRLIERIIRLKSRVQLVASGDFRAQVTDESTDEMGQLGSAVDAMARQLDQLWQQVNRQQAEKLLFQIAGGMAHQLRNTLTGSRMAMELHRRVCHAGEEEVAVAIRQLEIAEDYVQRLLRIGAGQSQAATPALLTACLADLESTYRSIAAHLQVELAFERGSGLHQYEVADSVAFTAAIANLIINALQAADRVSVQIVCEENHGCKVEVSDHGPGVDPAIADQVFEPFITSKPEGMGLGLAVVRRAAKDLGGEASWHREGTQTVFTFRCPVRFIDHVKTT